LEKVKVEKVAKAEAEARLRAGAMAIKVRAEAEEKAREALSVIAVEDHTQLENVHNAFKAFSNVKDNSQVFKVRTITPTLPM
jgi:hypothetical protein